MQDPVVQAEPRDFHSPGVLCPAVFGVKCSMTPLRLTTRAVPVAAARSRARCAARCRATLDSLMSRSLASSIGRVFMYGHSSQLVLAQSQNYHIRPKRTHGEHTTFRKLGPAMIMMRGDSSMLDTPASGILSGTR